MNLGLLCATFFLAASNSSLITIASLRRRCLITINMLLAVEILDKTKEGFTIVAHNDALRDSAFNEKHRVYPYKLLQPGYTCEF
jgi:hypothetical protein